MKQLLVFSILVAGGSPPCSPPAAGLVGAGLARPRPRARRTARARWPGGGGDWCHVSARLDRTALHRRLKGAARGHEDEKLSFVLAVRDPVTPATGRVLRHPQVRTGMVRLEVCRADGTAGTEVVTKREREAYRAARGTRWGDPWPPPTP